MAITSYRFVSPGVQVQEIDNSQLPNTSNQVGPTIIGRFEKGPANRPVYITSLSQMIDTFGKPIAGRSGDDVWRDGNYVGSTYAAFAVQAWLRNTPAVNVIRLLGNQSNTPTGDATAKAGWKTAQVASSDTGGGAYGLFVIPSGSVASSVTGTLAAIWYIEQGAVALSGNLANTATPITGTNTLIASTGPYAEFKAIVTTPSGSYTSVFNLNSDSDKYIRRVFNTNPILTNTAITSPTNTEYYWLGESFERSYDEIVGLGTTSTYGFIAPLVSGTYNFNEYKMPSRASETGWVIAQDLTTNTSSYDPSLQQKLFKLVTLDSGEWDQRNIKVSIRDIAAPATDFDDYGTFTVEVRLATDTDNNPKVVEVFTNVDLNPVSPNYIARKIGDKYVQWDDTNKRLREYGTYSNVSKYVRVEMDPDVDAGSIDPTYLPFGFFGPPRVKRFTFNSGSALPSNTVVSASAAKATNPSGLFLNQSSLNITGTILFPSIPLRLSASSGGPIFATRAYFGITTGEKSAYTTFDRSYYDMTRAIPSTFGDDAYEIGSETNREYSFIFSLDDVSGSTSTGLGNVYVSGSRAAGTSVTAKATTLTGSSTQAGYRAILTAGYTRFTMPLYNGFDGFDITEAEPLRNTYMASSPNENNNYAYYTYSRAIDTIADPEALVTDIVSIPGLTNESLTTKLIETCEARADALAIVDLPNVYIPESEAYYASKTSRYAGTAKTVAQTLQARGLNSSYGATYYPWVQIRDSISDQILFVPPSVVALGAMSYGQRTQELWFAPAGFTRGGLSEGRGGVPVIGVSDRLSSTDRDTLYEANINPIAQFPAEGIVIFGQKTLQVTRSALDRINVRRLMIYLKREISRIAATLLFDQNVEVTWSRFLGQVNPFLSSVKSRLGLTDFRVILDSTTTTPDLVDRNILYAKVFLKPARAIEFIAIDFTITDSGASFVD
jgi:hypothetical protein